MCFKFPEKLGEVVVMLVGGSGFFTLYSKLNILLHLLLEMLSKARNTTVSITKIPMSGYHPTNKTRSSGGRAQASDFVVLNLPNIQPGLKTIE